MAPRHKAFASAASRAEPISFSLDGEEFHAAPVQPAAALEAVAEVADVAGTDARMGDQFKALMSYMDLVLLPESSARLSARMRDAESPVSMEDVASVAGWLIEEYGGRPTEAPSSSPDGGSAHGETSTPSALSVEDSTHSTSPSTAG